LEIVVDLACPQTNHLAKIGKDVGAAGVLIAAGSAVAVGIFIMGPPLLEKIRCIF
jgi:diacylglycerol kinase